ncbi:MAG: protein-tyrosine phosphatase family protein [Kiritimatiellia bacterium]
MNLYQVDDAGCLFISAAIEDWSLLASMRIDTIFDLDGSLDAGVPTVPDQCLYIYFPIYDKALPNLTKLTGLASLGALLVQDGHHVLSHYGMGFNRSALLAGLILHRLGMSGSVAVERLRQRRPGALFNDQFAAYLLSL